MAYSGMEKWIFTLYSCFVIQFAFSLVLALMFCWKVTCPVQYPCTEDIGKRICKKRIIEANGMAQEEENNDLLTTDFLTVYYSSLCTTGKNIFITYYSRMHSPQLSWSAVKHYSNNILFKQYKKNHCFMFLVTEKNNSLFEEFDNQDIWET